LILSNLLCKVLYPRCYDLLRFLRNCLWFSQFCCVFILLLRGKHEAHIYISLYLRHSQQGWRRRMFANNMLLDAYFDLRFNPKRRTKKNFAVSISGPKEHRGWWLFSRN